MLLNLAHVDILGAMANVHLWEDTQASSAASHAWEASIDSTYGVGRFDTWEDDVESAFGDDASSMSSDDEPIQKPIAGQALVDYLQDLLLRRTITNKDVRHFMYWAALVGVKEAERLGMPPWRLQWRLHQDS